MEAAIGEAALAGGPLSSRLRLATTRWPTCGGRRGRNFRIEKSAGGVDLAFYYNENQQLLEEHQGTDEDPLNQYVWDLRYVDAPIVRFHDANTNGSYGDAGDNVLYYTNDANMNVTGLVDSSTGAVVERYHYDPYGAVLYLDPSTWNLLGTQASAFKNDYLYTGRRLDAETDLFYYRARYYDAALGRFISRDPAGYVDGANLYQYVGGTPVVLTDPSGLQPFRRTDDLSTKEYYVGYNIWWDRYNDLNIGQVVFGMRWSCTRKHDIDVAYSLASSFSNDVQSLGFVAELVSKRPYKVNNIFHSAIIRFSGRAKLAGGAVGAWVHVEEVFEVQCYCGDFDRNIWYSTDPPPPAPAAPKATSKLTNKAGRIYFQRVADAGGMGVLKQTVARRIGVRR
ncbi:MAG: RHS repeat-associated core domain-containing protein [Planctomycetota bacterium]|nr:MAG: RHS repeat-associated core domain-containing protein [Planctomycetota bacterium]